MDQTISQNGIVNKSELRKLITLAYAKDHTVQIDENFPQIFIDGRLGALTHSEHQFILQIARNGQKPSRTIDFAVSDPHKRACSLRKKLEKHGLRIPMIEAVRAVGYKLVTGWTCATVNGGPVHDALRAIRQIAARCVQFVDGATVQTNGTGVTVLTRDAGMQAQVLAASCQLEGEAWKLMGALMEDENAVPLFLLSSLRDRLTELLKFVMFWRFGERIDVTQWRNDFRAEIGILVNQFEAEVAQALKMPVMVA